MRVGESQLIGQTLNDTYRLERLIGEGGMGAVYLASHVRLPRQFAVKVLAPAVAKVTESLQRFRREALITSALGHPHILEIVDFNVALEGIPYIVMELLEGEDLGERLARKRFRLEQVASIFQQTAGALSAAHQQGVIHRDLKPQNIFLCRRGLRDDFVKVVDFGISKVLGAQSLVTKTDSLIGTPLYMSPEQAEGRSATADPRTDIFSLGVIVFQMLGGRPPFTADSLPSLLYQIVHTEPPRLAELRPGLPDGVEAAVLRALRKSPAERYGTVREFWEAFARPLQVAGVELRLPLEDCAQPAGQFDDGDTARAIAPVAGAAVATAKPGAAVASMTTISVATGEVQSGAAPAPAPARFRRLALIAAVSLTAIALGAAGLIILTRQHPEAPAPAAARAITPPRPDLSPRVPDASAVVATPIAEPDLGGHLDAPKRLLSKRAARPHVKRPRAAEPKKEPTKGQPGGGWILKPKL